MEFFIFASGAYVEARSETQVYTFVSSESIIRRGCHDTESTAVGSGNFPSLVIKIGDYDHPVGTRKEIGLQFKSGPATAAETRNQTGIRFKPGFRALVEKMQLRCRHTIGVSGTSIIFLIAEAVQFCSYVVAYSPGSGPPGYFCVNHVETAIHDIMTVR